MTDEPRLPTPNNPNPARTWCGTLNNPDNLEDSDLVAAFLPLGFKYLVAQLEVGDSGTPHLQFYVEFKRTVRFTRLKKALPTAHFETRRGSRDEARNYCMKDDTRTAGPWEHGTWVQTPGQRTDLEGLFALARSAVPLKDVYEAYPASALRYHRGIDRVRSVFDDGARPGPPQVRLLVGPPGCGKTRLAHEEPDLWVNPLGRGNWFDGYDGQHAALFDDFAGRMSHHELSSTLRTLDRYALRVQTKGGHTMLKPMVIYLTTNYHPRSWWDWSTREPQWTALSRRFTHVTAWSSDGSQTKTFDSTADEWDLFWDHTPDALDFFQRNDDYGFLFV